MVIHSGGRAHSLPSSKRHYLLAFFQSVTTSRKMSWSVSKCIESVHVGILILNGLNRSGPPRSIISLYLGNISRDVPVGENSAMVPTFFNQFLKMNGNYHATDFQTPSWVHSFKQLWWSRLTLYVLDSFEDDLKCRLSKNI